MATEDARNRRMRPYRAALVVGGAALVALFVGCAGVLGFDDYIVSVGDSSVNDPDRDSAGDAAPDGGASCGVDLSVECYPCAATTTEELLNACGGGDCIPFDRSRLTGLLAPDGALPALPPPDGG